MTKAMKMVAAARLKRAQNRLESARPYARKMAEVTSDLASLTAWSQSPLLVPHPERAHARRRILVVVFTGDRGMAGGFHQKIADGAVQFGKKFQDADVSYYVVGVKGQQRFLSRRAPIYQKFGEPVGGVSYASVQKLAQELTENYLTEQFDQIYLYYAKFVSAMTQRPRAFQLLPIDPAKAKHKEEHGLFLFEPNREEILKAVLPRYIESEVFRAFLETEVGELGARMTAMSSATDNAADLINRYQLELNRLRQSQITKEISEIVGGAEALKG